MWFPRLVVIRRGRGERGIVLGKWIESSLAVLLICLLSMAITLVVTIVVSIGEYLFPYGGLLTLLLTTGGAGYLLRHKMDNYYDGGEEDAE